jgi:hypothetical protein
MRNYNIYLNTDETDDDILAEWEEVLLKDFLKYSREWLTKNTDEIYWRIGLE